jgi:hypothetical protein
MKRFTRRQWLAFQAAAALAAASACATRATHVPRIARAAEFEALFRALEAKLLALYERCRVTVAGRELVRPCANPHYDGLWHDDFTWPHLASERLRASPALADALAWLGEHVLDLPVVPDRVEFDGFAVMSPGPRGSPMSERMTLHLPSAWVRLLSHCESAGIAIPEKRRWAELVARSFEQVPFESGLVWSDPRAHVVAFGFQDSIRLTGHVLTTSLVTQRGLERAAALFERELEHAVSARWRALAAGIPRALATLFDEELGGFVGASVDGRAFDVWGNGLAWPFATPAQRAVIARTIVERRERIFLRGATRQVPAPDGWPGTAAPIGYQNGGYWATGTGFVLPMLAEIDAELALEITTELVRELDLFRSAEWLDAAGAPHGPADFLASLSMPTLGLRAVLERRPLLSYL